MQQKEAQGQPAPEVEEEEEVEEDVEDEEVEEADEVQEAEEAEEPEDEEVKQAEGAPRWAQQHCAAAKQENKAAHAHFVNSRKDLAQWPDLGLLSHRERSHLALAGVTLSETTFRTGAALLVLPLLPLLLFAV